MNLDTHRSMNIGLIFQNYNLLTNTTALQNVLISMEISKVKVKNKKEFAYDLLNRCGIDKAKACRNILKLSGGEQQRVAIARALSHNPDVIIADEPTGNLDEEYGNQIMDMLCYLAHEKNTCVIVVTHARMLSSKADEVLGLNKGKLVYVHS